MARDARSREERATGNALEEMSERTRRALLGGAAAGGAGLLAGCSGGGGGDGDGTPTSTPTSTGEGTTSAGTATPTQTTDGELAHVEGQTLTLFTMQGLDKLTWFQGMIGPFPTPPYNQSWTHEAINLTMQNGANGRWRPSPAKSGEYIPETFDSIDITPDEITIDIREDATWSNGDTVTASDALPMLIMFRLWPIGPGLDEVPEEPLAFYRAVTDYEVPDEKTVKLYSNVSAFDEFLPQTIWGDLTRDPLLWGGVWNNTNLEPFDEMWSALQDWFEMAQNGEIDAWGSDRNWDLRKQLPEVLFGDHGWSSTPEENDYDLHWEKYYRDPENVVTNGAWTLKAINGTQNVTLEPNEHHYAADQVNFDEIKIVSRQSSRANRAALNANRQDYYRGDVPQHIVESFPDDIEQRLTPQDGGLGFALDHRVEPFTERKARQAIMYAIDRDRLGQSVHQSKYSAASPVGAHGHGADSLLGGDWIDENMAITYERDIERATQLMSEAGYSKSGGQWVDSEGNVLSVEVPTASSTPTLEPTFASQLQQFGIDASIQTYGTAVYGEKREAGEFNIWPEDIGVGYQASISTMWFTFGRVKWNASDVYRVYPEEQVDQIDWGSEGRPPTNTVETWEPYKIQAPPVGEPDGDLQTYQPASDGLGVRYPSSQADLRERARRASWLYSWYVPTIPIANGTTQHFLDTAHWNWPAEDDPAWDGIGVGFYQPEDMIAYGKHLQANPENPEDGASVQE